MQTGEDASGNTSVRDEPAQPIKIGWGAAAATGTVETGAPTWFGDIETQLADDVVAQHRVARRKAKEAAAVRAAEARIRREAGEAARREAEGPMAPGSWGKWGAGWRVKPPAEQKAKTWLETDE